MAKKSAPAAQSDDGIGLTAVVIQFSVMLLVFWAWSTPLIQPIKLVVVLFHEMSHGLMAILTGGKVIGIWITPEEGGACETEGGLPLLIVGAGYLGSMFFGGAILHLSRFRAFVPLVYGGLALMLVSAVVTVLQDSYSRTFAAGLVGTFIVLGFVAPPVLGGFALRILGTVCCLYSIFDVYWDILSERGAQTLQNDAVVFSRLSGIDVQTVGLSWLAACVVFFLVVLRLSLHAGEEDEGSMHGGRAQTASA